VILAGGRSRRMGRDKATLEIGGQTLFERTLARMTPVTSGQSSGTCWEFCISEVIAYDLC
ncbi:MAG: NTP transferase domain-containing protein, partial [Thermodesulfobacteriota bacterium]|nr:NTP transferase domain-containing protein [Thermodesulfobacteriota bacterium]